MGDGLLELFCQILREMQSYPGCIILRHMNHGGWSMESFHGELEVDSCDVLLGDVEEKRPGRGTEIGRAFIRIGANSMPH